MSEKQNTENTPTVDKSLSRMEQLDTEIDNYFDDETEAVEIEMEW